MAAGAGFTIQPAAELHLAGILAIYNHAVAHTTAIWNEQLVDLENRRVWWRGRVDAGFPVLVAVGSSSPEPGGADSRQRAGEGVLGYASYGPFRAFDAYRFTVEQSVYVAESARGRGIGRALLTALEAEARRAGMHVIVGGIAADNAASLALHASLGFVETGRMPEVGHKFGRWLDLVLVQKRLDDLALSSGSASRRPRRADFSASG